MRILDNVLTREARIRCCLSIMAALTILIYSMGASGQNGQNSNAQTQKQLQEQIKANPSGDFTWDMGTVYPGVPYSPAFPLSNGCPFDQLATITYPNPLPLKGPREVEVPPGTITKYLSLYFEPDKTSYPEGFCTIQVGVLTAIHHEDERKVPGGTYTCFEAKRTYLVSACVYHGPGGGDGGGGKPKKQPATKGMPAPKVVGHNPCAGYWTTYQFVKTPEVPTPDFCTDYIRQQAHLLFDQYLQTNRAADPAQWAWLPTDSAIDSLSVEQIMTLKVKALAQLL